MTKWHAHVAHMTKYMDMVGSPRPPKSGAACNIIAKHKMGYVIAIRIEVFVTATPYLPLGCSAFAAV